MNKEILDWAEETLKNMVKDFSDVEAEIILMRYLRYPPPAYPEIYKELHLGKKKVIEALKRFDERILGKEGKFAIILRFYKACVELHKQYRKAQKRQQKKQ